MSVKQNQSNRIAYNVPRVWCRGVQIAPNYLTSKKLNKMGKINEQAETKPCTIHGVMWRCSRQFRMKVTKEVCFKNGGLYEQVKEQPLTLKDEDGIAHELAPHWVKWFHNAT